MLLRTRSLLAAALSAFLMVGLVAGSASSQVAPVDYGSGAHLTELTGTAQPSSFTQEGDIITTTWTLTNTSGEELPYRFFYCPKAEGSYEYKSGTLGPEESVSCESSYMVSSLHISRGYIEVRSQAFVQNAGQEFGVEKFLNIAAADQEYPVTATLQADQATFTKVGETINLEASIVVPFSDQWSLSVIYYADDRYSTSCNTSWRDEPMPNDGPINCTAHSPYVVSPSDVERGYIDFSTYIRYHDERTDDDTRFEAETTVRYEPWTMAAEATQNEVGGAGDEVALELSAVNNTSRELTGVQMQALGQTCGDLTVPAGGTARCTLQHPVTQSELDAGAITGEATLTAGTARSTAPAATAPFTIDLAASQAPAVALDITADRTTAQPGQQVNYTVTARNSGNLTLTGAAITGSGALAGLTCPTQALAPGATVSCTGTHTVTDADLTTGSTTAAATITADAANGTQVTGTANATVKITTAPAPETGTPTPETGTPAPETAPGGPTAQELADTGADNRLLAAIPAALLAILAGTILARTARRDA